MKSSFSTFQLCEVLDIEKGRLRQWMNMGHIQPTIQAKGKGTRAEFTVPDAIRLELYRRQVDSGFSREVAVLFISALDDKDLMKKAAILYSIETKGEAVKVYPRCFDEVGEALEHLKGYTWKGVHILNLENARAHVLKQLKAV